ncbi:MULTISPECIES: acetylornithine deacetylase [unclassified Aureimonas]|uniref:acetylornithine deacetylase n=1 Tax=unclassified Aureimonas TaxID=2615206 RepID=UPI0006F31F5C|nr:MULTISPECIES: acetylornithine deacetylase [unclassified Aureimonas]KQT61755.1 acetylornithine deacetylase [Aureimonas sp. Leaf460]KQT65712.1 acetylornithine deacetylase [Aureimonas sp. Leaf427]
MTPEEILARLVGFPSVVGRPNAEIVAFVREVCEAAGAEVAVLPGPEGDRANLFATIGPRDVPGVVLSGHMDVVPAGEADWSADPFTLRRDGDRLYGRGTSDMKGFLAAVLAALPRLRAMKLKRPIHLAFSYDEEAGCRGVPHLIAALPGLCAPPEGCIVGEPSGLKAIRAHKGKAAARIGIGGRSGHSSRPDLGLNAIHAMAEVLAAAARQAEALAAGPFDPRFAPPYSSLQIGTIAGGQALNVIPETCTAEIEARAVAGVDPLALLQPVREVAEALSSRGFAVAWDVLSHYPALSLGEDAPLARLLEELTGEVPLPAVSYGTEAGLYQAAGIASIICGPGDIARAHRADEYIETDELAAATRLVVALGERLAA